MLNVNMVLLMKSLIRNLAAVTAEQEVCEMFESYDVVQSCNWVLDKVTDKSKEFGFIEMLKRGDANAAMKHLNGVDVDGNKIRVKEAESKE